MGNLVLKANEKIKDPKDNNEIKEKFNDILEMSAKSTQRTGDERKYRDLAAGRFALNQVVRIERTDDTHTISNKWFDFSYSTISQLIQQGINDALKTLVGNLEKPDIELNKFINVVDREERNRILPAKQATQLRNSAEVLKGSLDHTKKTELSTPQVL
jgi:hypothetical protein